MPRAWSYFNPRTPCGVRPGRTARKGETPYFNPRTPCGVRLGVGHILYGLLHFNPRTPCGVRRRGCRSRRARRIFQSTHPVRGATVCAAVTCGFEEFQSTHPVRGATCRRHGGGRGAEISIHAPRAGCDTRCAWSARQSSNFNPRTPCGVRQRKSAENSSDYCLSFTKLLYLPAFSRQIRIRQAAQNAIFRCEAPGESMCTSGSHLRS